MKINNTATVKTIFFSTTIVFFSWCYAHSAPDAPKEFSIFSGETLSSSVKIHDFTGLPLSKNGWTNFEAMIQTGYKDSRVVFVSSSEGNDSTGEIYGIANLTFDANGMFQPKGSINAYKTIANGYTHIRDGYPDILLLKREDQWVERFDNGGIGIWRKSGRSQAERIILSSYGLGSRPTLLIGNGSGITTYTANNLIFSGLRIFSHTWEKETPLRSVDVLGDPEENQLYEDCVFERNDNRIQDFKRIAFRRNQFIEGDGSTDPKIYSVRGAGLLLEENIFYSPITANRHFYLDPDGNEDDTMLTGVVVRKNIFYTSMRTGLSYRSGGILDNNLIVRNDQILAGGAGGSKDSVQSFTISNNVFLESTPDYLISPSGDGEYSLQIQNNNGSTIKNNIWTDPTGLGNYTVAIMIKGDVDVNIAKNIDISNNIIHKWAGLGNDPWAIATSSTFTDVENVRIYNNDFQTANNGRLINNRAYDGGTKRFDGYTYISNRYYSPRTSKWFDPGSNLSEWVAASGEIDARDIQVSYPDSERTLKTYNVTLGGNPSTESFMLEALRQSRYNYQPKYTACAVNNYIREGFGRQFVECEF